MPNQGSTPDAEAQSRHLSGDRPARTDQVFGPHPQIQALEAVLEWARRRGYPAATLRAFQTLVADFGRDPSAPNLELVMRAARADALRR